MMKTCLFCGENKTNFTHPMLYDTPMCVSCTAFFEGLKSAIGGTVAKKILESYRSQNKKPWEQDENDG